MNTADALQGVIKALERTATDYELAGVHAAEFIPDATPVSPPVVKALEAAVLVGCAIGIRDAVAAIKAALNESETASVLLRGDR